MVGFGTCRELTASLILPLIAAGSAGSKVTLPETPVPTPLIDSSGASVLNTTLLTPLGSLKLNSIGAAFAPTARLMTVSRGSIFIVLRFVASEKRAAEQHGSSEKREAQKIHARHEFFYDHWTLQFSHGILFPARLGRASPTAMRAQHSPESQAENRYGQGQDAERFLHFSAKQYRCSCPRKNNSLPEMAGEASIRSSNRLLARISSLSECLMTLAAPLRPIR